MWQQNFQSKLSEVRALGFDDRFIRKWHYYLCYCEAGFEERHIGLVQLVLAKPLYRSRELTTTSAQGAFA